MAVEYKRYHRRLTELVAIYKEGRQLYDYHVMDQGKSDLCAAEISITLFKKFASFRRVNIELSHIDSDIEKGHANIR